ncbi:MAG: UDP-glucose 4-epimerase, partial [Mycobacteriales bacterium]
MPPHVVLVTGVSRNLGSRLAARLSADPSIDRIIGVDTLPPGPELAALLGRTEFVRADIRNPLIGKVIASASVDTVVHMNISSTPAGSGGRAPMKELNVIGTMQLLAACQRAASVQRVVLKSTTAVYGASSRDPAVFTEAMQARAVPSGGFAKDSLDIEGFVRAFARRRPEVDVAVL